MMFLGFVHSDNRSQQLKCKRYCSSLIDCNTNISDAMQIKTTEVHTIQNQYTTDIQSMSEETFSCCRTSDGGVPLDITMKSFLRHRHGFYIESGANDGIEQSNTYFFAKHRQWHGILIEPAQNLIDRLKFNRPESIIINVPLVSEHNNKKPLNGILENDGNLMGKIIKGSSAMIGRSLSSILDDINITSKIDFWSLDVEGYELEALQGMNFVKYRPKYILIEVWESNKADVFQYMQKQMYSLVPGIDAEGSQSGWTHYTAHRDYLWIDCFN